MADVREAGPRRHRKLLRVRQAIVVEVADPVHLEVGDEGVPVGDRSPAGVGVQVDAGKPERGRYERRCRLAVRPKRLAIHEELGVELARAPARGDLAHGCLVHLQQIGQRLLVRGEGDDRADVEITIGPAVEATPDSRSEGVVDGRMADGAGETDRAEMTRLAK